MQIMKEVELEKGATQIVSPYFVLDTQRRELFYVQYATRAFLTSLSFFWLDTLLFQPAGSIKVR